MADEPFSEVIAVGTWLYDGRVKRKVELIARPAKWAEGRWLEGESGGFELDESAPIPQTIDGRVYYVGASGGGEFGSAEAAITWANSQPWGPVRWRRLKKPHKRALKN